MFIPGTILNPYIYGSSAAGSERVNKIRVEVNKIKAYNLKKNTLKQVVRSIIKQEPTHTFTLPNRRKLNGTVNWLVWSRWNFLSGGPDFDAAYGDSNIIIQMMTTNFLSTMSPIVNYVI